MLMTDADQLREALAIAVRERDEARAAIRTVAERQREADTRNVCGDTCRRAIRRTPLVTKVEP